ncbi:MAG: hypothetical protein HYY90_03265 [Candidatus Omnitrophica bacterium]|nr:hypothetical protein [Candidatus Omnitrophota bacterium]MBI3021448.1 hypothetical protein [Candidatus Omnitrophota bacterium]MBI3083364.1 hypothetical protein [Candidatus Omnitrophota bacterium]
MNKVTVLCVLVILIAPRASAQTPGEERFFADCPHGLAVQLHDETNPWDLHAALYTTLGVAEVEVLGVMDWVIDLPFPGARLRPFHRLTSAVRSGYNRLPPWWLRRRVGELVGALQLPELSLGDAATTYSVATGGATGPGSGTIIRLYKVIDWTQRLTGDLNQVGGRLVGRPHGLVRWSGPERAVDGLQWLLIKAFTRASVLVTRMIDAGLSTVEAVGDQVVNAGYRRPHQQDTAFLRLPIEVYRAHELWILEHQAHVVLGTAPDFARSTHAALAHRRVRSALSDWSVVDRPEGEEPEVIMMTSVRWCSRMPDALKPYVVPAAWVLNDVTEPARSERIDNRAGGL